jgi:hypothetical protein
MNWKEFFKPTKWKIVLTVLLSLLYFASIIMIAYSTSILYGYQRYQDQRSAGIYGTDTGNIPYPLTADVIGTIGLPIFFLLGIVDFAVGNRMQVFINLPQLSSYSYSFLLNLMQTIGFIANTFYLYLLSCLIFWVYNKLKKKK